LRTSAHTTARGPVRQNTSRSSVSDQHGHTPCLGEGRNALHEAGLGGGADVGEHGEGTRTSSQPPFEKKHSHRSTEFAQTDARTFRLSSSEHKCVGRVFVLVFVLNTCGMRRYRGPCSVESPGDRRIVPIAVQAPCLGAGGDLLGRGLGGLGAAQGGAGHEDVGHGDAGHG